jgi:ribosomal protein L27
MKHTGVAAGSIFTPQRGLLLHDTFKMQQNNMAAADKTIFFMTDSI